MARVVLSLAVLGFSDALASADNLNTLLQILTGQGGQNMLSPYERPPPRYGRTPVEQGRKRDFDAGIVRDVQRKLDSMGYATGVPDGVFGPRTAQALMDFQRDHGLPLTGAPDQPTIAALDAAATESAQPSPEEAGAPAAASFDCRRAASAREITICRTPDLARLDAAVGEAYDRARASAVSTAAADEIRLDERNWVSASEACGADVACLRQSLTARLGTLEAMAANGAPSGEGEPAPMEAAGTAGELSPAGTSLSGSAFSADMLIHPPAGFRPQKLFIWHGLVVLNHPDSGDQESFIDLAALGMRPQFIEEQQGSVDEAAMFSNHFLAPDNPLAEKGYGWPGQDEFEKRDTRNAFLTRYADFFRGIAPKAPFSFAYTYEFNLPDYDAARGGYALPDIGTLHLNDRSISGFQSGGVTLQPDFDWPSPLFWPAGEAQARQALKKIRAGTPGQSSGRRVRLLAVLEATSGNAETLTLSTRLKKLAIYDDSLDTELFSFDVSGLNHQAISAKDPISGLTAPPPGVEPWVLQSVGGHPVIMSRQGPKFFGLVRYAARPQAPIDEYTENRAAREYLTAQAQEDIVDPFSTYHWKGKDEFAQARSRQLFETRFKPALLKVAPKAPFEFYYAASLHVGEYDETRGAFQLSRFPDLRDAMRTGGLQAEADFEPPVMLWHMPRAQAPAALHKLNSHRSVMLVARVEVKSIDGATGNARIGLGELGLYTPDGRTKLYDFPVHNDMAPFLTAAIPAALEVPSPAPLDEWTVCAELLSAYGAQTPDPEFQRCWQDVAERDQRFYQSGAATAALGPADAARPFFPRGGAPLDAQSRAAFLRWAGAYAAGLADHLVVSPEATGSDTPSGKWFPALSWGTPSIYEVKSLVDAESLQLDQLSRTTLYDMSILFVLPNRVSAYAATLPPEKAPGSPGPYSAQASFRLGKASAQTLDGGRPALLIRLAPQSIAISSGGRIIDSHVYDVPPLSGAFTASPTPPAARETAGPLPLDRSTIDLLTAGTVGEKLSREALAFIVTRRWAVENSGDPVGGDRFFVVGKRQPTPMEAAELGPQFVAWAKSRISSLPMRVTLRQKLSIRKGQGLSWSELDCFGGSYASLMADNNLTMGINSGMGNCQRKVADGTANQQEKLQCIAGQAALASLGLLKATGAACNANVEMPFADPVTSAVSFDQDLSLPDIDILGSTRNVEASMILEITGVDWSAQPPQPIEALPTDMQASLAQLVRISKPDARLGSEFVTLAAHLASMRVLDESGKQLTALQPSGRSQLQSLADEFHKIQKTSPAPQATTQSYGPDLVGVRLGMSFDEAEAIVRKHMEVGRVLDGKRASDEKVKSGFNEPMTSGKLFISKDGREFVALIDEPPAAGGRVVAAWRRVYVPADTYAPEELFAKITEKYGPPTGPYAGPLQAGSISGWYNPAGANCPSLFGAVRARPLAQDWTESGRPAAIGSPNSTYVSGPALSIGLYDPLNVANKLTAGCGPLVTLSLLDAQGAARPAMELDMTLTDLENYILTYSASRKLLQAQAAKTDPASGDGAAAIKF